MWLPPFVIAWRKRKYHPVLIPRRETSIYWSENRRKGIISLARQRCGHSSYHIFKIPTTKIFIWIYTKFPAPMPSITIFSTSCLWLSDIFGFCDIYGPHTPYLAQKVDSVYGWLKILCINLFQLTSPMVQMIQSYCYLHRSINKSLSCFPAVTQRRRHWEVSIKKVQRLPFLVTKSKSKNVEMTAYAFHEQKYRIDESLTDPE